MPFFMKRGDCMYFAEGKLRQYESMMTKVPNFDSKPVRTMKERDCKHCLYYDKPNHKCSREKCYIFED